jgi:hypothetical protein
MDNTDIDQKTTETCRQPAGSQRPNRHPVARALILSLGGLLAIYLVGRGITEFFTVHYSDPASYRNDWGGPSLAGVFAVHSAPGVAILITAGLYLRRRWSRWRQKPS